MKILDTKSAGFAGKFEALVNRSGAGSADRKISETVLRIIDDVRKNGDSALFRWTRELDALSLTSKTARVSEARMKSAEKEVPPKLKTAIKTAFKNIKKFHRAQVEKSWAMKTGKSSRVGQLIRPLARAGLYVPGGTASYPSSVLMNAIPAMVAGVKEIIICSPAPGGELNPAVLYAASLCGIREFYTVGGAQAVAAMAYGTATIKKVDKITGPGNAYVAEAKRQVFGQVDIDMIAGPSEICVIADGSARPDWIAADLLSQAEHDERAFTLLVSPSGTLIRAVMAEIEKQIAKLARKEIARKCMKRFHAVKTRSLAEAINLANEVAAEHVELSCRGASRKTGDIKNGGALFVGNYSPEVLGDYMAGPNHVLPTAGSARFFSPLGVYDFIKRISLINYSREDFLELADMTALFAESEKLTAHAQAARIRKESGR
jgi:histidinol dehydrogenase